LTRRASRVSHTLHVKTATSTPSGSDATATALALPPASHLATKPRSGVDLLDYDGNGLDRVIAALAMEAALRPDPGTTSWVLSGGVWGASLAGLTALALQDGRALGRWLLVGEVVGVVASLATARTLRPTQARTRWLDLGALVGGLLGFGAGMLLFSRPAQDWPGVAATAQLGIVGGGVAGWFLAPGTPRSPW
jgi:hypothetical protein